MSDAVPVAVVDAQRASRTASLVLELTRALSSALDIRDVLHLVVTRIAEVVAVDRVSIVLGSDEDDTGYVIAASDDNALRDLPVRLDDYPEIRRVLDAGEPLVISDATGHPWFELTAARGSRFRSLALFPIASGDDSTGVLFLRWSTPTELGADDRVHLGAIANAAGIALRNARLLRSLRQQSDESKSARVRAEARLEALERYAGFFDSMADGIVVLDATQRILFCNPAACRITGHSAEALRATPFDRLLPHDGRRRYAVIRRSFEQGEYPTNVDLPLRTSTGRRRVLNVSFNSLLHAQQGVIVSLRDVTVERTLERELTRTKEFLERVINASVDAIVSADMTGRVLLFNPAAERTYGYRAEEVVGVRDVRELYPPGTAEQIMRLVRGEGHGGPGLLQNYRTELLGKGGEHIPVLLTAALIVHRKRPIGSLGVFKDLRAKLRIEARLRQTQEELAVQEKKALIAELAGAAAHELNQPLTAVMGYASLLARHTEGDVRVQRATGAIVRETERMADIVRKIGRLTHYETKPYVGETKIVDLDRAAESEPAEAAR